MKKLKEKLKLYNQITNFSDIGRRYFINNFYDGNLTILGILLGFFVVVLKDPIQPSITSTYLLLPGLGTAISMFISGLSGSYLSERAEQKKNNESLARSMGISKDSEDKKQDIEETEMKLQKAMLKNIKLDKNPENENKKKKKPKTIRDKAEKVAGIIVALINGGAPFLGGLIPLIPFAIVQEATVVTFIMSFLIIFLCIVILGVYLGHISQESIIKNIIQMLIAFSLTLIIVILFLG